LQSNVSDQTAERESVVHTIGIEPAHDPEYVLALVERDEHGKQTGEPLDEYGPNDEGEDERLHPFAILAAALIDAIEGAAEGSLYGEIKILPLSGAVLAALGQPLYTDAIPLHADQIDAPVGGPYWQIHHARTEEGWHDVTAVAPCAKPGCEVMRDDGDCTVIVCDAYRDGYAHWGPDATLSVRIPASAS
jgi:hypothetical protein